MMKKIVYFLIAFVNFYNISTNLIIKKDLSTHFDQRINSKNQRVKPKYIILHYTANCDERSILKWFKNYLYPVSAHYVIAPNGTITMTVDPSNRAWHAGESYWKGCEEMNAYSIGIEIINPGSNEQKTEPCKEDQTTWSKKDCYITKGSENCWYPFTTQQITSVIELCKKLMNKYKISSQNIIGHSDIAPGRKIDPGPLFPWSFLAQHGIGLWPEDVKNFKTINMLQAQKNLALIGYNIKTTGILDDQTKKVLIAFQMHFRPNNIDGQLDQETFNILTNMANMTKTVQES
jgi:N-acetyl-anhydromuramyl-L-alanine amidase AmpD